MSIGLDRRKAVFVDFPFRNLLAVGAILMIALAASLSGDPGYPKTFCLLVGGSLAAGILLCQRGYWVFSLLPFLVLFHLLRPEGLTPLSLLALLYVGCFLGLLGLCLSIPDGIIKKTICWAAILQAIYGIMQIFYDPFFLMQDEIPDGWRIFGTFGNKQYWTMFLFASIPLFFTKTLPGWFKRLGLAIIGIALISQVAISGEIGFSEMAGIVIFMFWLGRLAIRDRWLIAGIGIGLCGFLFAGIVFAIGGTNNVYIGVQNRIIQAQQTIDLAKQKAVMGWGLGTYKILMPSYEKAFQMATGYKSRWGKDTILANAHNEYLQAWFELGIVGLIGSMAAFGYVMFQCLFGSTQLPYWYSLLFIGLFAWVHFPLHLSFMSVFILKGAKA